MYYPDDDTLVIERKDVVGTTKGDDDSDTSLQTPTGRRYKGYCSGRLNPDLLLCKIFYFTFYGSYGCLYPLIAVYFKQLGLGASQSGILVGIRPFVEFCAAPMWGAVADSWRKAKGILLFSLLSWLIFTEAIAFIQPAPSTCVLLNFTVPANATLIVVGHPEHIELGASEVGRASTKVTDEKRATRVVKKRSYPLSEITTGHAKRRAHHATNDTSSSSKQIILVPELNVRIVISNTTKSKDSTSQEGGVTIVKYKTEDTNLIFVYIFLFMILGEFFSSPTITLADSATLGYLGHPRMELYGRQRMFGSLAWGIFMFVEGLILERTKKSTVECDGKVTIEEENYLICFGTYAVLITCSFFVATQFQFKYQSLNEAIWKQKSSQLREVHNTDASETIHLENVKKTMGKYKDNTESIHRKDSSSANEEDEPKYTEVLGLYASVKYGTVLYVVWFTGFGFGFLFTFLYWHLKDLGGPPSLFGVASIINHLSEVMGYFFSSWFIRKLGHIPVLCLGLMGYAVRFIVVSYLVNPWWVLAVETLQGVTHALVWAASTSLIAASTSQRNRSSAQGILQGVYHGLGRGCGAIFGGVIIGAYGSTTAFRAIGITYVAVTVIFACIQYMEADTKDRKEESEDNYVKDDDHEDIVETELRSQDDGTISEQAGDSFANAAIIGDNDVDEDGEDGDSTKKGSGSSEES